jgi:hypothetical protein
MKVPFALIVLSFVVQDGHAFAVPKPEDTRAAEVLHRMAKAYQQVGDFIVTSQDTVRDPEPDNDLLIPLNFTFTSTSTARWAADGRRTLFFQPEKKIGMARHLSLFDGTQLVEADYHQEEIWTGPAELKRRPEKLRSFFRYSFGLDALSKTLDSKARADSFLSGGPLTYRDLGGGKVRLESRLKRKKGNKQVDVLRSLILGKDGFLERVEERTTGEDGKSSLLNEGILSRPAPLTIAKPFDWVAFAPASQYVLQPEVRATVQRAAYLYGGLESYEVELQFEEKKDVWNDVNSAWGRHLKVSWDRRGWLRVEDLAKGTTYLIDGKVAFRTDGKQARQDRGYGGLGSYETLAALGVGGSADLSTAGAYLVPMLMGQSTFLPERQDFSQWKAILKRDQTLDGVACDIVEIEEVSETNNSKTVALLWFAQDNGRLLRVNHDVTRGKEVISSFDLRLEKQRLDPQLPALMFKFVPSK